MRSKEIPKKPQIRPVSLSKNGAKMSKINRQGPKSNQFWRWSEFQVIPNLCSQENVRKLQIWPVSLS